MTKKVFFIFLIASLIYPKSFFKKDYIDGHIDFDLKNSTKITAVLPFLGDNGKAARDYAELYLGIHTNLNIIERAQLDELLNEQDLYQGRLNEELRAKIKELYGADFLVLGQVWSKNHISFFNILLPWMWKDIVDEHWFVKLRVVNVDTGEIESNYYLRDDDGYISFGFNEYYLSETIEKIVLKMLNDSNDR